MTRESRCQSGNPIRTKSWRGSTACGAGSGSGVGGLRKYRQASRQQRAAVSGDAGHASERAVRSHASCWLWIYPASAPSICTGWSTRALFRRLKHAANVCAAMTALLGLYLFISRTTGRTLRIAGLFFISSLGFETLRLAGGGLHPSMDRLPQSSPGGDPGQRTGRPVSPGGRFVPAITPPSSCSALWMIAP